MQRLAISGSHGFLGKHLFKRLERLGYTLERIDRNGLFSGEADWIFDLGAYGNLFGQNDKKEMLKANVIKLGRLLLKEYEALVYISSSSVGLKIQTDYSKSKKEAEDLLKRHVSTYDSPAVIVRPYTIIGQGEPDIHLIPKLINSCLYGEKMPFVPAPVHDFVDVRDLVEALILIAKNADKHKGETFEIGTGKAHANWEIKELIEEICGTSANLEIVDSLRPYDTRSWVANNSKITRLGWKPKYTLKQTIFNMVSEYLSGV